MMTNLVAAPAPAPASAVTATAAGAGEPDHEFLACLEAHVARLGEQFADDGSGQLALALPETDGDADEQVTGDPELAAVTVPAELAGPIRAAAEAEAAPGPVADLLDEVEAIDSPESDVDATAAAADGAASADGGESDDVAPDGGVAPDADSVPVPAATADAEATEPAPTAPSTGAPVPSTPTLVAPASETPEPAAVESAADGDEPTPATRPAVESRPLVVATSASSPTTASIAVDGPTEVDAPASTPDVEDPWEQLATVVRPLRTAPDGSQRLSLQLRPAELGAVHLEVSLDDGVLSLRAVAETTATRDLLTGALPELRADLTRSGLSLGTVDVGSDTSGDASADADRDTNAPTSRDGAADASGAPAPLASTFTPTSAGPGRLDLVI